MSANNQLLIKEHNKKWYLFDVIAESWSEENELSEKEAIGIFDDRAEAIKIANEIIFEEEVEYGILFDILAKDGASVKIIGG